MLFHASLDRFFFAFCSAAKKPKKTAGDSMEVDGEADTSNADVCDTSVDDTTVENGCDASEQPVVEPVDDGEPAPVDDSATNEPVIVNGDVAEDVESNEQVDPIETANGVVDHEETHPGDDEHVVARRKLPGRGRKRSAADVGLNSVTSPTLRDHDAVENDDLTSPPPKKRRGRPPSSAVASLFVHGINSAKESGVIFGSKRSSSIGKKTPKSRKGPRPETPADSPATKKTSPRQRKILEWLKPHGD
jgi:hypothetical protein